MSMLSEQCAKLRKLSEEIRALQRMNSDWLWKDSAKLVDAADMLREAADTIESLRERAQAAALGSGECEWPTDSENVRIRVADTIHMLRSDHDGDHEWEDVVIELAYCEHGGDKWIVRGARGEAWACYCTVTGHDEELYDKSDDWENLPTPWDGPEPDGWYKCPDCGCAVGYTELYGGGWSIMLDCYQIPFNACPKCGRRVDEPQVDILMELVEKVKGRPGNEDDRAACREVVRWMKGEDE